MNGYDPVRFEVFFPKVWRESRLPPERREHARLGRQYLYLRRPGWSWTRLDDHRVRVTLGETPDAP